MHEAQTPDDGVNIKNLNSVDSSVSSEATTNPFYSILAGEHKARELLLLAPAAEESISPVTVDNSQEEEVTEHIDTRVEITIDSGLDRDSVDEKINSESHSDSDWVAEPDVEQQRIVNAEFDKLLQLNEELQNANNQLYEQAEQLTTALSESEAALGRQRKRSNVAESMLKQQTQELNAAQAQIQSLFEQLEHSVQNAQRQENLAQSYKGQLELNQQHLAQLERECASIQHKYSEQTRLLSQSENACRELRTRLKRQQRQTLQFKAALEKSLETSIPGYDTLSDSDSNFLDVNNSQLNTSKRTKGISNTQSIKPWSVPTESDKIQNDFWEEIPTSAANNSENSIEDSTWEFTANPHIEADEYTDDTQTNNYVNNDLADGDRSTEEVPLSNSSTEETIEQVSPLNSEEETVEVALPSDSSDLETQLESVIQTFFAQTESVSPQSPQEQDTETDEDDDIASTWTTIIEPRGTNNHVVSVEAEETSFTQDEQITFTSSMNDISTNETGDYWEEVSQYPAFDLSENPASFEIISDTESHDNSPSPLIYPKRPPKGRKSLASVELPKFPQKGDGETG